MSGFIQALAEKLRSDLSFSSHFPEIEKMGEHPLLLLDKDYRVILVNFALEQLFLCNRALILQRPLSLFLELSNAEPKMSFDSLFKLSPGQVFTHYCKLNLHGYDPIDVSIHCVKFVRRLEVFYLFYFEAHKQITHCHFENSVLEVVNQQVHQSHLQNNYMIVLTAIVNGLPGRSHFKSADGFAYQVMNQKTLQLVGFDFHHQMAGMDDYKLAKHLGTKWPANYADELQNLDAQAIAGMQPIIGHNEKPYLDAEGRVVKHSLNKIPIYDLNGEPIGIITFCIDKANLLEPIRLYELYQNLYNRKKEASSRYIRHIGLDQFLKVQGNEPAGVLTSRELECLLMYTEGSSSKQIGKSIGISNRTVETYLESVRYKMDCPKRSQINEAMQAVLKDFRSLSRYVF